jgi:excisionase family DNA binding protein
VEKLFSTTELSRMWNVSESTVKRWADSGELRCIKTVGGHRRFQLEEISRFQRSQGFDAVGILGDLDANAETTDPLERALERVDSETLSGIYFQHAVEGRGEVLVRMLGRAYLRGIPPIDLLERIVTPALRRVGDLWRKGELTVADEHLATRTTVDVLTRLQADLARSQPGARVAVVGCSEGELHEIGSRCAGLLLEVEGWQVISLGTNTPFFSFEDMLGRYKPQLVCIGATIMTDIERQAREYARFYETARAMDARVVLGGEGFRDPVVLARFPHDAYATSFRDLLRVASAI